MSNLSRDSESAPDPAAGAANAEQERRYPPDQQFGSQAAADQERVDERGEEAADAVAAHEPRAGNKAETDR